MHKSFNFDEVHLSILYFVAWAPGILSKNSLPSPMSWSISSITVSDPKGEAESFSSMHSEKP